MQRVAPVTRVSRAVRERWRRLSPRAQVLITAFAVHPEPIPAGWLARLARDAETVDELTAQRLLVEQDDGGWALREPAARGVLTKLAGWAVRQEQHRALAR